MLLRSLFLLLVVGLLCVPFVLADDPPEMDPKCIWDYSICYDLTVATIEAWCLPDPWPCGPVKFYIWITQFDRDGDQLCEWFGDLDDDESHTVFIHQHAQTIEIRATSTKCGFDLPEYGCGSIARTPSKEISVYIWWH